MMSAVVGKQPQNGCHWKKGNIEAFFVAKWWATTDAFCKEDAPETDAFFAEKQCCEHGCIFRKKITTPKWKLRATKRDTFDDCKNQFSKLLKFCLEEEPARKMEEAFLVERTCPSNAWKHLARRKNMSAFWCGVCHKWNAMVYFNQSQRIVQASCTPKSSKTYCLQSDFLRIFLPWEGIDEEGLAKKLLWDLGSAPKNAM